MDRTIAKCYSSVNSNLHIPPDSRLLFNASMDAAKARRLNLIDLAKEHGGLEGVGAKTGTAPGYLSEIKNGTRGMGAKVARRFEDKLRLGDGWMDTRDHSKAQKSLDTPSLVADFEALPPVIRDHIAAKTKELRDLFDAMPPHIRNLVQAPPADPERYAEWERSIKELIASEGR